jgi:fatty-acyl-CoA synthase
MTRPDPDKIYELIEKEGVTHMCGAPIVWARLGDYMEQKGFKFPRRIKIEFGGATPPLRVIRSMESKGGEVIHGYGLTESLDGLTICEWQPEWDMLSIDEQVKIKARQGIVNVAASEIRVVDDNMQDVPCDGVTIGEIIIRGNILLKEYFKQSEETMEAFRGGWFHTGDGAAVYPDGYLEIKDRFKDIIISGGENIASIEVENVLSEHPDISEVACFAVKDDEWGEVVKALVTPKPGTNPSTIDIIGFCRQRIAHYKCPKMVEFGEIPRSSTGKVLKDVLRKRELGNNLEEGK